MLRSIRVRTLNLSHHHHHHYHHYHHAKSSLAGVLYISPIGLGLRRWGSTFPAVTNDRLNPTNTAAKMNTTINGAGGRGGSENIDDIPSQIKLAAEDRKKSNDSEAKIPTSTIPIPSSEPTHLDIDTHPSTSAILEKHTKYSVNTYLRPSLIFTHGKGCHLYDLANRPYLDFTAGIAVNALGHADPELAKILYDQSQRLIHLSNLYYNEYSGELAELLVEATRGNGGFPAAKVFFTNSGTEANEGALKFAKKWGKVIGKEGNGEDVKYEIVSFSNAFHGRSLGALSATPAPKYQKPFTPLVPGFINVPFNDVGKIQEFVTEKTCGVIIEPIQGEGGINEANIEFLEALKIRCQEVGALLIFDEIQCGLGRTGKLWAHQHFPKSCHPDILTTAKPMANGIPIGAIIITDEVADLISIGDHGTTFGGNPLACRAAISVISRINSPNFLEHVQVVGSYLRASLQSLAHKHPTLITEIRGRGLILGVQFTRDPTSLVKLARERGLLIITASNQTVRIVPPLILTKDEAARGVEILEQAIEIFKREE